MKFDNNSKYFLKSWRRLGVLLSFFLVMIWMSQPTYGAKTSDKKVIVIGFDGMDPRLSEKMMDEGLLPNFDKLRQQGGYKPLATSNPPQSPVAWANFINGAGPGTHGIFDFIHRNPEHQYAPFYSSAETVPGEGSWEVGKHKLQLTFWPFNHQPTVTYLRRKGKPFWDYLDEAEIPTKFYDIPANYPPSPSHHGHHSCLSGMGTPDMLGTYGTYQHISEDGPARAKTIGNGKRSMLFFEHEKANAKLYGPKNDFLINPEEINIDFRVYRDLETKTAAIEIQSHNILLQESQWSQWIKLDFELTMPSFLPNEHLSGICKFYLQEVSPNFRLYVTPINIDPSDSAVVLSEPEEFVEEISQELGLFYTTGFQEDFNARKDNTLSDAEYIIQTGHVLEERLKLMKYSLDHYDTGLLFFYFSSTDLQAHILWWDSDEKHPSREPEQARNNFDHIKTLYRKADAIVGDLLEDFDEKATIIVMSDHGFSNFKRQFNLNRWLRDNGYVQPSNCTSLLAKNIDWSQTQAYGLGLNGLYLNLKGRERDGIVETGPQRETLLNELIEKLQAIRDVNGNPVIRKVYRTDEIYHGPETYLAPDLLIGYHRGYRAAWATGLGNMNTEVLFDNDNAWGADHCIDPELVPGVIFSNKRIRASKPSLIDVAPSILAEFGLDIPEAMTGKNIF